MKFLLQFCCMNLIAATRAEGGLVYTNGGGAVGEMVRELA